MPRERKTCERSKSSTATGRWGHHDKEAEMGTLSMLYDQPALRAFVGDPIPITVNKELKQFDEPMRRFLSMSTILFISTVGTDGKADVSPRGDPPGFIKVLDGRTFAIPDRPGNRRVDTMS